VAAEALRGVPRPAGALPVPLRRYQAEHPELAAQFARHDLFAADFQFSCLNRLQLRNNQQMMDLSGPSGGLRMAGRLDNPLAKFA
jgi:siderophore synthetase component